MSKKQLVDDEPIIKEEINEFSILASGEKAPVKKASTTKKEEMSRFNVYLPTKALDKLKIKAVREHRKIKDLIEEAILSYLEEK